MCIQAGRGGGGGLIIKKKNPSDLEDRALEDAHRRMIYTRILQLILHLTSNLHSLCRWYTLNFTVQVFSSEFLPISDFFGHIFTPISKSEPYPKPEFTLKVTHINFKHKPNLRVQPNLHLQWALMRQNSTVSLQFRK